MVLRSSPSGPAANNATVFRWYAGTIADAVGGRTGFAGRDEAGFNTTADPIPDLSDVEGQEGPFGIPSPVSVTELAISYWPGDSGDVPTGDADVVWQIQTFDPVLLAQADVEGATLSFGPAEYTSKSVSVPSSVLANNLVVLARGNFPTNWTEGTQNPIWYINLSVS